MLQPIDIVCFGPFERIYNKVSHKFMREICGKSITKYIICEPDCSACMKALSSEKLRSSFRKAGIYLFKKKGKRKVQECLNHKPQPFLDPKRKRKPTNPNKHKSNKRTKSTKISSLFPKRGNHNTKRTEEHKNKMTHGKTYNKSPRRINHKATKSKTNTGTTSLERSVEQTTVGA